MKLIPVNKNVDILKKCGYDEVLEFNNDQFHGHQKGVAICIINKKTGVIEQNMLRQNLENRDALLQMILTSKNIVKVVDDITQMEGNELVAKQVFYIPYVVERHSVFKNTVNWDNVNGATNVSYELDIEILFVHENLNRYITIHASTKNVSIMDIVYGMFEEDDFLEKELPLHGIEWKEPGDEDGLEGYVVDFYDEAGGRYEYGFPNGERLRDAITSIRLIGIEMEIDENVQGS